RVPLAGPNAAGDEIIARALRRATAQKRRLQLQKAVHVEIIANYLVHSVAQDERALERRAAQVEITILQPQVFIGQLIGGEFRHGEGRRRAAVEDLHLVCPDLDLARTKLGVLLAGKPMNDGPFDGDDPFAAQLARGVEQFLAALRLENDLGDAVAVAEIDEHEQILIAAGVDPPVENDGFADVGFAQLAAGVSPPHERHDWVPSSKASSRAASTAIP